MHVSGSLVTFSKCTFKRTSGRFEDCDQNTPVRFQNKGHGTFSFRKKGAVRFQNVAVSRDAVSIVCQSHKIHSCVFCGTKYRVQVGVSKLGTIPI